jgi:hypothetical protein
VSSQIHPGNVSDALEHGKQLQIDGMGDARLDVYSTLQFYLHDH